MALRLAQTTLAFVAMVSLVPSAKAADKRFMSTPRDTHTFYYTCDGFSLSGFPIITAHFSTSTDLGNSFFDNTLESFLSPAMDNGNSRQRVLGDYQQVKAIGNTFFGGFAGNRVGFYPASPLSITDPIFFKVQIGG